ncbi:MAG: PDZ domain-containing protein [Planctomycetaceae bacterium]
MESSGVVLKGITCCRGFTVATAVVLCAWAAETTSAQGVEQAPGTPAETQFQPGDISIGDPVALPFAKPVGERPAEAASPRMLAAAPAGWLGMAVAESQTAGRWAIVDVAPAGPAAAAGIRVGDELRTANGQPLTSADAAAHALTAISAGQQIRLTVARAEREFDVTVVAVPRPSAAAGATREWQPAEPASAVAPATVSVLAPPASGAVSTPVSPAMSPAAPAFDAPKVFSQPGLQSGLQSGLQPAGAAASPAAARGRVALGVRTVPIDAATQQRFHLPAAAGAYVIGVVGDLPASKAGIPPGAVIVELGDRPVRSPQELTQLVAAGPTDRPVPLRYVLPGGTERRADVVLQSLEQPLERALVEETPLQPAAPPALQPGPSVRTARRPDSDVSSGFSAAEAGEVRREVRRLRAMLEALEKRLDR